MDGNGIQRMRRRDFLGWMAAAGAIALPGCATTGGGASKGKVVVVGGGFGGATAAKYIRMWSGGTIDVTLVDPANELVSCPLSNLVLGGSTQISALTTPMGTLVSRHGVKHVRETAVSVDVDKRLVRLSGGAELPYDRLVVAPGIDFFYDQVPGLPASAQEQVPHAWKAGPQTLLLRRQLEAMPDGGTFAMTIPVAPYRCPPGPYERACQVAWYFKQAKPRSKVLILDANPDVTSKAGLFKKAWNEEYKGIVEYRPNHAVAGVDPATRTVRFDVQENVRADVLNVIPPQGAGAIARSAGVVTANNRWCEVDFLTFESIKVKNVHVIGDAIQIAPAMPKSASMANNHAKVAAAAIVALLSGQAPNPTPVCVNTCYSFITDKEVVHVASVHQYDRDKKTLIAVQGAGGLSPSMNALEGDFAWSWAKNVWADAMA